MMEEITRKNPIEKEIHLCLYVWLSYARERQSAAAAAFYTCILGELVSFVPIAVCGTFCLPTKLSRQEKEDAITAHTHTHTISKYIKANANVSTTQKKKFQFHFGSHCFSDSKGIRMIIIGCVYEPPPRRMPYTRSEWTRTYTSLSWTRYLLPSVLQTNINSDM